MRERAAKVRRDAAMFLQVTREWLLLNRQPEHAYDMDIGQVQEAVDNIEALLAVLTWAAEAHRMTDDLERIGRHLEPHVIAALADHLDRVSAACQSVIHLHHAPGGVANRIQTSVIVIGLDVSRPKSVPSA